MDARLAAPFDPVTLVAVSGLAAGYGIASSGQLTAVEMTVFAGHPAPAGVAARLTFRVLHTADTSPETTAAFAGQLLAVTEPGGPASRVAVLLGLLADDDTPAGRLDAYLEPAGDPLERLDETFTALRAALAALSGRPLGNVESAQRLARAAAARLS